MGSPLRNVPIVLGCIVILAAAGLRFFDLGGKVIHADESVQAWKTGELLERGDYHYDPQDHHGPTLYYLAAAVSWLAGERSVAELQIKHLRILPAFAGTALAALTLAFGAAIGWRAALLGAAFTATSPLLVYYSRHFIQESLLILFSAGVILAGWRWRVTIRVHWAVIAGGCAGMLIATKETWGLVAVAMTIGCFAARATGSKIGSPSRTMFARHAAAAGATALTVAIFFYTSFFTHVDGLVDAGRGIVFGLQRTTDSAHAKPWPTYLSMLAWSSRPPLHWTEAGLFLGVLCAIPAIRSRPMTRFLAGYAVTLLVVYSLIPYKTPWLACGFWHGFAILAGCGADRLLGARQPHAIRGASAVLIVALLVQLSWQAHRAAGPLAGAARNPYAYVETSRDIMRLPERLAAIAAVHPERKNLQLAVAVDQPWPLPWFLRDFPNTKYDTGDSLTEAGDVLLVSPDVFSRLPAAKQETFETEFFGLRDGELVVLAVESALWERSLSGASETP